MAAIGGVTTGASASSPRLSTILAAGVCTGDRHRGVLGIELKGNTLGTTEAARSAVQDSLPSRRGLRAFVNEFERELVKAGGHSGLFEVDLEAADNRLQS